MKKKYPFILSILLTLSILLPVNTYASAIEVSRLSDFSRDVQLCDGARNAVFGTYWYPSTGVIKGTGQPGSEITVDVYYGYNPDTWDYTDYNWFTATVNSDGNWSVTAVPIPKVGDFIVVYQYNPANGEFNDFGGTLK